jgi:nuclear pore complex protein Nup62
MESEISGDKTRFQTLLHDVNEWDVAVLDNGTRIEGLHAATQRVGAEQAGVQQLLDRIVSQQSDVHKALLPIEQRLADEHAVAAAAAVPDPTFALAEDVAGELDAVRAQLTQLTEAINAAGATSMASSASSASAASAASELDPVAQLVRVLDEHMTALQWVEEQSGALQHRVHALELTRQQAVHRY